MAMSRVFWLRMRVRMPVARTLPLFATGLGALGLLGWHRKQKNISLTVCSIRLPR
jgi:hypothetical protein